MRKVGIVIFFVVVVGIALFYGWRNLQTNYLYEADGNTIAEDASEDIIKSLKEIEDINQKQEYVDFAIESHMITEKQGREIMEEAYSGK